MENMDERTSDRGIFRGTVIWAIIIGPLLIAAVAVWFVLWGRPVYPLMMDSTSVSREGGVGMMAGEEFAPDSYGIKESANFSGSPQDSDVSERKIVRTASLSLLVEDAEGVAGQIREVAGSLGGFVEASSVYDAGNDTKAGFVSIRVPVDRLDEALETIRGLAVEVEREETGAQDVTDRFVDFEARLKNMRAEEVQYLAIMERAETVEDTLNVASRLSDVRGRIEVLEGQLDYLSKQTDMATISVSLTSEADVEVLGVRWAPLVTVKQSFRAMLGGFAGYADGILRFLFLLPVILAWLLTIGIGLWIVIAIIRGIRKRVGPRLRT